MKQQGGTYKSSDTTVSVKDADTVTIYISIATNFKNYGDISNDENDSASIYLKAAISKSYAELLKAHVAGYQKYFHRVKLDLGFTDAARLPTDERLRKFDSVNDPQFVTLYYQYGRYLLISSSQPGGQPANLQGIWNNQLFPAWDSKYTININAEMNYWPAEKTNLSEMHAPFLEMIKELSFTGKQTARRNVWYAGMDGASQYGYLADNRCGGRCLLGNLEQWWWLDEPASLGALPL